MTIIIYNIFIHILSCVMTLYDAVMTLLWMHHEQHWVLPSVVKAWYQLWLLMKCYVMVMTVHRQIHDRESIKVTVTEQYTNKYVWTCLPMYFAILLPLPFYTLIIKHLMWMIKWCLFKSCHRMSACSCIEPTEANRNSSILCGKRERTF
jgi:hypothetical protein